MGADKALCLKLGYVTVSLKQDAMAMSKEVGIICQCLNQIYKCSHEHKLQSFRYAGATELIPLLSQVLKEVLRTTMARKETLVELDEVLYQILRVLRMFSKLTPAKSVLVNHLRSALLGHLASDALIWIQQPDDSMCYFSPNVFWETLGLLKDLTFRSESHDKGVLLCTNEGIFYHLLTACCRDVKNVNLKLQEWFTAVVWNLALDSTTCEWLIGHQTLEHGIIQGLLEVLMHHSVSGNKSELVTKIKRNAASALGNFLADARYHGVLFEHHITTNTLALLPRLMNVVEDDNDSVVRRRAMRTIRYLVSSSDSGVQLAVKKEKLPERFLANIIGRNVALDDENDHDTQIQACQAVISMSNAIQPSDWLHLVDTVSKRVETTTDTKLVSTASLVLIECIKSDSRKIDQNSFSDLFWKRIETAVAADYSIHNNISSLYRMLAQCEKNAMKDVQHAKENPSILTSTSTLNAMALMLSASSPKQQEAAQNVLQVLGILVEDVVNKKPLADNEDLLSSLVNLCLVNPGQSTKDLAKRLILQLIPEI